MDLCSDEVGKNSKRKDSNVKRVPKDQRCIPVYLPCAPYSPCTPRLINLPFPNEFNWSYTGRNYDEQVPVEPVVPVVPEKKRKVKTEENKKCQRSRKSNTKL
uniref:Uncharacterized protein n=1 Tax=Bactrocera dorsalis TaxID=27457 RepID=A0A034WK88_BACDO